MRRFATIGVYGFSADTFVRALHVHGVDLLLDVRQRRGVRGAEYSWANAVRLQRLLADAGIEYEHVPTLAPTTELRQVQYREDAVQHVGKRSRRVIADEYRDRYVREILDLADLPAIIAGTPEDATIALFCVEAEPAACHRSLIAGRLRDAGAHVVDIVP